MAMREIKNIFIFSELEWINCDFRLDSIVNTQLRDARSRRESMRLSID